MTMARSSFPALMAQYAIPGFISQFIEPCIKRSPTRCGSCRSPDWPQAIWRIAPWSPSISSCGDRCIKDKLIKSHCSADMDWWQETGRHRKKAQVRRPRRRLVLCRSCTAPSSIQQHLKCWARRFTIYMEIWQPSWECCHGGTPSSGTTWYQWWRSQTKFVVVGMFIHPLEGFLLVTVVTHSHTYIQIPGVTLTKVG